MNNTAKVVIAGLTAALVYDGWAAHKNREIAQKNQARYENLQKLFASSLSREVYLAEKLDAAGVPFTEFDKVMYNGL